MSIRVLSLLLAVTACGGTEPLRIDPPAEEVSLLVRDDAISASSCGAWDMLEVEAKLEVSGVLGACRVFLKSDGSALSLCDEVPGKQARDLELTYFVRQKTVTLSLVTVRSAIDLTTEAREMVEVDFSMEERIIHDEDGDGISSYDEICNGRDPRDPNG